MSASVITCERIRKGQPAAKELHVSYQDDGRSLPSLYLYSDWSNKKGDFRTRDRYDVEEIPSGMGRAFLLHRTPAAVAADPDHVERYGVLVAMNPQDHLCECRGFAAHGYCKHISAVRELIDAGHLDHPEAGRPSEPFPSPQQLADEAGVDLPF